MSATSPRMYPEPGECALVGIEQALAALLDQLAYGVLIVASSGELMHANRAAMAELGRREFLTLAAGKVRTASARESIGFVRAVSCAACGKRSLISLGEGACLQVMVAPLMHGDHGALTQWVTLTLSRCAVCDPVMLCLYSRAHGLTLAEERVLAELCRGSSAPQIAAGLHVAESTIRTHIHRVCLKTHSGSIRALLKKISLLPPTGSAHAEAIGRGDVARVASSSSDFVVSSTG